MSSEHDADDSVAPVTDTASAPGDPSDEPPATMRLGAFELAFAIATMEFANDEGDRPIADDDPTIELPAPRIPAGVPSPLGDEEHTDEIDAVEAVDSSSSREDDFASAITFETLALCDLDLDLEGEFSTC